MTLYDRAQQRGGYIGQSLPRKEDPRLVTGRGCFVADIRKPGTLHAALVRSRHGHARILGVRTERALQVPGVEAVLTFADFAARAKPIPMRLQPLPSLQAFLQYPLASTKVRYVGEP